jgi:hypothetical protein
MLRPFAFALAALSCWFTRADDTIPVVAVSASVKIGNTDIKLSMPPGMVEMPKDNPITKAVEDLVPADCVTLRNCISSDGLDLTQPPDPTKNIMTSATLAMKSALMDIDSGDFVDFVDRVAVEASHGDLRSKDSAFDYVESQSRLDKFQQDTGIGVQDDSDVYSLGMVSRSYGCVSYMEAQYVNATFQGKTERLKCVSVVAYLRLQKKVVITVTSLTKLLILHDDLRKLKEAAEKYQMDLQILNNM